MFAFNCLRDLVQYLERMDTCGKLQILEVRMPACPIRDMVWQIYRLPHCYLSAEFSFWSKRLLTRLFGYN